jgi:SAM-dependent methyltransferase
VSPDPADAAAAYGFDFDWRDHWWADDFLDLLARRHGLGAVRRALDVGCGAGHWSLRVLPRIHEDGVLQGVDADASFVGRATARAAAAGLADRTRFEAGDAQHLPYPDACFDLVTAQTVLMHVPDPARAVAEMVRVLVPGGLLLLCEPDNAASLVARCGRVPAQDPALVADRLRLHLTLAAGRRALGGGDDDVGARLPALLQDAGVVDVDVCMNERCTPLLPPYEAPAARAELAQVHAAPPPDPAPLRPLFEAGGGDPDAFDRLWAVDRAAEAALAEDVAARRLRSPGGLAHYVVTGRKPA